MLCLSFVFKTYSSHNSEMNKLSGVFSKKPLNRSSVEPSRSAHVPANVALTARIRALTVNVDQNFVKMGVFQKANHCEDRVILKKLSETVDLYAVLDGHGGDSCVNFLCLALPTVLKKKLEEGLDVETAIKHTFEECAHDYDQCVREHKRESAGAVGVLCLVKGTSCCVASVGDCRALVSSKGGLSSVNTIHRASVLAEKERVEAMGGVVTEVNGVLRVQGSLMPTRTFGDLRIRESHGECECGVNCVHPVPDIHHVVPEPSACGRKYMLLMSDGFYDVCTDEQATACIEECLGAGMTVDECTHALGKLASKATDDVSLVLLVWN